MNSSGPMDQQRQRAWRRAWSERLGHGGDDCPGDQALAELATGELVGDERTRVADHLTGCARCTESYRLLVELDRAARAELGLADARRARSRSGLLIAAAVLVGVLGLLVIRLGLDRDRGSDPATAPQLRGELLLDMTADPAQGAVLAAPPVTLSWRASDIERSELAESRWIVEIYDAEMRPLWRSELLDRPQVGLPEEARLALVENATYYWRVRAQTEGRPANALFRFRIER